MLEEVQIDGNDVKKYTSLDFAGVEMTGANSIDISGMDYISVDFWTPNATKVKLKLVDWGADNAFGGGDDTEHEVEFMKHSRKERWISTTTNLSDFTGLKSLKNISQIILAAEPAGSVTALY
jgi:hypothetical protein